MLKSDNQYIIIFFNDITHYFVIYTISNKFSAIMQKIFEKYIALVEIQIDNLKRIKRLRMNDESEYIEMLTFFFESYDIIHKQTISYFFQSNDKMKKKKSNNYEINQNYAFSYRFI